MLNTPAIEAFRKSFLPPGTDMADDGTRHFPNAQYYITQADYDFWTDEKKVGPDLKVFWETAMLGDTDGRDVAIEPDPLVILGVACGHQAFPLLRLRQRTYRCVTNGSATMLAASSLPRTMSWTLVPGSAKPFST